MPQLSPTHSELRPSKSMGLRVHSFPPGDPCDDLLLGPRHRQARTQLTALRGHWASAFRRPPAELDVFQAESNQKADDSEERGRHHSGLEPFHNPTGCSPPG